MKMQLSVFEGGEIVKKTANQRMSFGVSDHT